MSEFDKLMGEKDKELARLKLNIKTGMVTIILLTFWIIVFLCCVFIITNPFVGLAISVTMWILLLAEVPRRLAKKITNNPDYMS